MSNNYFQLFALCIFLGLNLACSEKKNEASKNVKEIWIDADLAAGLENYEGPGFADVDDGYAILQLMRADNIHINGISAVFGNSLVHEGFPLCKKIVDEFSSYKIDVFQGAAKGIDLNKPESNEAVEAMAESLRKQKMTIAAIGPATNIALLVLNYPELKSQIEEVVLVMGRRTPNDHFYIGNKGVIARDFNFELDTLAFKVLLEQGLNITLCPFEISSKVWLKSEDLNFLSKRSKWLTDASKPWLAQWKEQGAEGFNPFDVLASHYIISPDIIVFEELQARLEMHEDDTGNEKGKMKSYLLCNETSGQKVRYCFDVVPGYHQLLLGSLE